MASWRPAYAGLLRDDVLQELSVEELEPAWRKAIALPEAEGERVWVAEEDERVIGYARVQPTRDTDDDPTAVAELRALYVDPVRWRAGAGRALMTAAVAHMVADGYQEATLWVAAANDSARRFYEHAGWEEESGPVKPFHGAPQVRYRKRLGGHRDAPAPD